jgi:predicted aminopeptidase
VRGDVLRRLTRHPSRRVLAWLSVAGVTVAGIWLLSGCAALETVDYYWQTAAGQFDLLSRARSIHDVIDESDDVALKLRLKQIESMRKFASRELGLPSNGSYTRYTDLGRPFVSWTVFATPELSLTPRTWCFPIAGCVAYRGYFRETDATSEASRLMADGDDVYIGHVPAYSTLGYFDDPVLSSFVRWPETDVARLLFHELAHQLIYVPGDTVFNESYAVTVERAGLERWLAHEHEPDLMAQFERTERTRAEFYALVQDARARLATIYASKASPAQKRKEKGQVFDDMQRAYLAAKAKDPGLTGYEGWFSQKPNNARIAALALYTDRVPAFRELLREQGDDLRRFYARVRELGAMPKARRDAILDSYQRRAADTPGASANGDTPPRT